MNLGRIFVLATNVFREVVRDRILYIIGFYTLILAAAIVLLPEFAASTEDKMFLDFGLAVMNILGLIVAVFVGTGLVNKEIEKRTVLVLITKPVSHTEFITGKYFGLLTVLAALIAAMTAIYLAFLHFGNSFSFDSKHFNCCHFLILATSLNYRCSYCLRCVY
jgi:ABC-type transport system involved in multi-copper enzyme maturation permease subunit